MNKQEILEMVKMEQKKKGLDVKFYMIKDL